MRANTLVDVLLELNIVNLQDVDREINRLAASLYDPRAQAWFKRCVRHWVLNIDWLKKPYTAKAEPRTQALGARGADWYSNPTGPKNLLWPSWHGEQPPEKPNVCQQCKGQGFTIPKGSTEPVKCKACKGTGLAEKVNAGGEFCETCHGTGATKKDEHGALVPAKPEDPGATKCKACKGLGIPPTKYKRPKGGEGVFMPESLVRMMLDEADPEQPGYDPKARTLTTNLHVHPAIIECPKCHGQGTIGHETCPTCGGSGKTRQRIDKDIEQNFTPFHPKKAKAKRLHGEAPTKGELQPYMKAPEASKKEFVHFDPIQVRRRDLFNRLQDVVNYLNYMYVATQKPPELSPEEQEDFSPEEVEFLTRRRQQYIKDGIALFKKLEVMKPDDINGFREIMLKAEEFADEVERDPAQFMVSKSGKVIARSGRLVMRKCTDTDTVVACAKKPIYGDKARTWCLKNEYNAESYLKQSPVFFIEKDGKAYVAIHPGSHQVKDPANVALDSLPDSISKEIAPLVAKFPNELPTSALRGEAENLANYVDALRRKSGSY